MTDRHTGALARTRTFRTLERLLAGTRWISHRLPIASAFVVGIWVNALSDSHLNDFRAVLREIYGVDRRPVAWIPLVATLVIILVPLVQLVLTRMVGTNAQAIRLAGKIRWHTPEWIRQLSSG